MQLICKKKELLEIKEESPLLTFYYSNPNFSAKIFCQVGEKHTFASEMNFILSIP